MKGNHRAMVIVMAGGLFSVLTFSATALTAVTNEVETPIPPLLPAHGELEPTFWEQNGTVIILAAALALILFTAIIVFIVKKVNAPKVVDPLVVVKNGLVALKNRPEDAALVTEVSRLLREYIKVTFEFSSDGMTNAEIRKALSADLRIDQNLRASINDFLKRCDEFKFAPAPPARELDALEKAGELVKRVATWKREQLAAKEAA